MWMYAIAGAVPVVLWMALFWAVSREMGGLERELIRLDRRVEDEIDRRRTASQVRADLDAWSVRIMREFDRTHARTDALQRQVTELQGTATTLASPGSERKSAVYEIIGGGLPRLPSFSDESEEWGLSGKTKLNPAPPQGSGGVGPEVTP